MKKADILTIPNSKRKEMFIDFMDGKYLSQMAFNDDGLIDPIDYNTATMPHEK